MNKVDQVDDEELLDLVEMEIRDTLNEYEAKYGHKEEKEEIGAV